MRGNPLKKRAAVSEHLRAMLIICAGLLAFWLFLSGELPEHSRVTIVGTDIGSIDVEDATNRRFHISSCCIEAGLTDVWWQGQWIDMLTHPDGEKAFQCWLDHEEAEKEEDRWRQYVF
jgi:hypothetical protein